MVVFFINVFIVEGGVIFIGIVFYGIDIIQKFIIFVKQFKYILVFLMDIDMFIGSIDKLGFEVCFFRGFKMYDVIVFYKFVEWYFYCVFYS